jgi:hypothetical protein
MRNADEIMIFQYSIISILIILSSTSICNAQTMADVQAHLAKAFSKIQDFHDSTYPQISFDSNHIQKSVRWPKGNYDDSLQNINNELKKYLIETLPRIPESLTTPIPYNYISQGVGVTTSSNKKFREWAWDTWMGGSMPEYWKVFEFATQSGIKAIDGCADEGPSDLCDGTFDTILSIEPKNGNIYYLGLEIWIADAQNSGQTLKAFAVEGSELNTNLKLFQTRSGLESEIELPFPEGVNNGTYKKAFHTISLRDDGRTLLVPLLTSEYKMTSKYLRYDFDGEHFVYKGVSK